MPIEEISKLIKQGDLFQGKIRIDRNDINEGSVFIPKYDFEIRLAGSQALNRALNGDTVAIRLHAETRKPTTRMEPPIFLKETTPYICCFLVLKNGYRRITWTTKKKERMRKSHATRLKSAIKIWKLNPNMRTLSRKFESSI